MSATNGVFRLCEVRREVRMSLFSTGRRHSEDVHSFVVEPADGFVNGVRI